MSISVRIRKCREFVSEIKAENDDEDVIYCGTIEKDSQKVEKIRNCFKTDKEEKIKDETQKLIKNVKITENVKNCEKISKNVEVKNEKEAYFEINLDEIEGNYSENPPKVRECRVILNDIRLNDNVKNLKTIRNKSKNESRSKCKFCNTKMKPRSIPVHMRKFHLDKMENKIFLCEFCDQKFLSRLGVRVHISAKHQIEFKSEKYECDFDGKIFSDKYGLFNHMTLHRTKIKCKICEAKFKSMHLKRHMMDVHADDVENFTSSDSKYKNLETKMEKNSKVIKKLNLPAKTAPKNQQKSASTDGNYRQCKYCGKFIARMADHLIRIHHTELKNKLFNCDICGISYFLKSRLFRHKKLKHFDGKIMEFVCDLDGKFFESKKSIKTHMQSHQFEECKICNLQFKLSYIRDHLKDIHGDSQFKCEKCPKVCKNKSLLKLHSKVHDKKIQCSICNTKVKSLNYLKQHQKDLHENPRSYECKICFKRFNQDAGLRIHGKIHKENQPKAFKCNRCDFSTVYKASFKTHQECHEERDKKYATFTDGRKCDECPKMSRNLQAWKDHKRMAHPKELLQCDLCGNYYKTKNIIWRHITFVHLHK